MVFFIHLIHYKVYLTALKNSLLRYFQFTRTFLVHCEPVNIRTNYRLQNSGKFYIFFENNDEG